MDDEERVNNENVEATVENEPIEQRDETLIVREVAENIENDVPIVREEAVETKPLAILDFGLENLDFGLDNVNIF